MIQIGVDELFWAKGRWWCHLLCDDFSPAGLARLHQFAAAIGLPARAFHDPPGQPRPHYDCTPELRERALASGALPLSRQQLVQYLQRGRSRIASTEEA
ncbi:MAG: DUF4031 domain-containing protein [Vulcanimicrobiota bacterium]